MKPHRRALLTAALVIALLLEITYASAQSPDPKLIEGAK
jgi:hypothetical protein